MNKEERIFGAQMDRAKDKGIMIEYINAHDFKHVLDLGSGTCTIDYLIKDTTKVTCVDSCFKADIDMSKPNMRFIEEDILTFIKKHSDEEFDCVILSAVLHELSLSDMRQLQLFLKKSMSKGGAILIREPYYEELDYYSPEQYTKPFKNHSAELKVEQAIMNLYEKQYYDYITEWKKHPTTLPKSIELLNFAFTKSYGEDSWYREKHEYRFTFSLDELVQFGSYILPVGTKIIKETYDKGYKKHFSDIGLAEISDSILYTNSLIIIEGENN